MPKKATTIKSCLWFAEPEKNCGPYSRWLGQQEAAREIVGLLESHPVLVSLGANNEAAMIVEKWLKEGSPND